MIYDDRSGIYHSESPFFAGIKTLFDLSPRTLFLAFGKRISEMSHYFTFQRSLEGMYLSDIKNCVLCKYRLLLIKEIED